MCFLQGLSSTIDALFIGAPNVCRGCVCFLHGLSIGIDALFIGAPNVCRGFVSVSCNDSLLV